MPPPRDAHISLANILPGNLSVWRTPFTRGRLKNARLTQTRYLFRISGVSALLLSVLCIFAVTLHGIPVFNSQILVAFLL